MRAAKQAHAEVLEYIIGLAELNEDLWRKASDAYSRKREGSIHVLLVKQRKALTAHLAGADPLTVIPQDALALEDTIVAHWDALHEDIKALWREYEFGERQDGPEMATGIPQLAQDAKTHQREPGEEG